MTANEAQFGYRADQSPHRSDTRPHTATRDERPPVVYVYGDRVCRKEAKQKQLYQQYGTAQGFSGGGAGVRTRRKRYKLVLENIINLFDSIEERRNRDVEAAKRSAVMHKKLIEHKRGLLLALFMCAFLTLFAVLVYNLFFGISSIYAENTMDYNGDTVIAASGVELGDKLYSFRASEAEKRITLACPYIRSVSVERTVPNRVSFALESDTAAYCVNIYGEKLVLSKGLRVLGAYDPVKNSGLTELYLPEVSYSVEGRVITFVNEKQDRFVREILACVDNCALVSRIGAVDLRDSYEVKLHCDGMYLLNMGGEKEFSHKLKMAAKTLGDTDFSLGTPAEIDLSSPDSASVRYDHSLDLTNYS